MISVALGVVALALGVGSFFALSPIALPLVGLAIILMTISERRRMLLGPFLVGWGATGVWALLPALTNRDPAVTYGVDSVVFLGIALAAGALGGVLTFRAARGAPGSSASAQPRGG